MMVFCRLVGIFTERDYLYKVAVQGRKSKKLQVQEVMTPEPQLVLHVAVQSRPRQWIVAVETSALPLMPNSC